MAKVNIYLTFDGECEEAFNFYKSVFGGEFSYLSRFHELPGNEKTEITVKHGNRIVHVALPISAETMLMGCDSGSYSEKPAIGTNFSISVSVESKQEADRIFDALSIGGKILKPIAFAFWGDYFGMVTDKFGINWMVNFEVSQVVS